MLDFIFRWFGILTKGYKDKSALARIGGTVFAATSMFFAGATISILSDQILSEFVRRVVSTAGSFLMVGSTSALIYYALLRPAAQEAQTERLVGLFRSELNSLMPKVGVYGLAAIEPKMKYDELFAGLQSNEELWWLDTYDPGYMHWRIDLARALSRGAKIKMLILEPNSRTAHLRASEIVGKDFSSEKKFLEELEHFYDEMLARASRERLLEIRTYDELLGCPIYLIRRNGRAVKAFTSLFLNPASFDFPHFVWQESGERRFLDAFEDYVMGKWQRAQAPAERKSDA